jgi:hypothetical protein
MTLPPLPKPFTNLPCAGSVTTSIAVWTSDALHAYGEACAAAEREKCAVECEESIAFWYDDPGGSMAAMLRRKP